MGYVLLDWSLNSFLDNLGDAMQHWGALIVFVIGTAMVIGAAFFIAKGLMSQGRGQTNWALTFLLLIIGGAFMATGLGGWELLVDISDGSKKTIDELGGGSGAGAAILSTLRMHGLFL